MGSELRNDCFYTLDVIPVSQQLDADSSPQPQLFLTPTPGTIKLESEGEPIGMIPQHYDDNVKGRFIRKDTVELEKGYEVTVKNERHLSSGKEFGEKETTSNFMEECLTCGVIGNVFDINQHICAEICNFHCTQCEESFHLMDSLKNHVLKCHPQEEEAISCNYCERTFNNKNSLRSHIHRKHKCERENQRQDSMSHVAKQKIDVLQEIDVEKRASTKGLAEFGQEFNISAVEPIKLVVKLPEPVAKVKQRSPKKPDSKTIVKQQAGVGQKISVNPVISEPPHNVKPKFEVRPRHRCIDCGSTFTRRTSLNIHVRRFHVYQTDSGINVKKQVAVKQNRVGQKIGIKQVMYSEPPGMKKLEFDQRPEHRCVHCGNTFNCKAILKMHVRKFHMSRKDSRICVKKRSAAIQNRAGQKIDIKQVMDSEPPGMVKQVRPEHRCVHCARTFTRGDSLKIHVRKFHTSQKDAEISFKKGEAVVHNKSGLKIGTKVAYSEPLGMVKQEFEQQPEYRCAHCDAVFTRRGSLNSHCYRKHRFQKDRGIIVKKQANVNRRKKKKVPTATLR